MPNHYHLLCEQLIEGISTLYRSGLGYPDISTRAERQGRLLKVSTRLFLYSKTVSYSISALYPSQSPSTGRSKDATTEQKCLS